MTSHRIAVVPGEGIGTAVMPEGLRVVAAVGRRFGGRMQRGRTSLHQGRNTLWAAGSTAGPIQAGFKAPP